MYVCGVGFLIFNILIHIKAVQKWYVFNFVHEYFFKILLKQGLQ